MKKTMTLKARIHSIARALCLTITPKTECVKLSRKWWLIGCVEGDQPLPQTFGVPTLRDALERVEAWLASEVDSKHGGGKK